MIFNYINLVIFCVGERKGEILSLQHDENSLDFRIKKRLNLFFEDFLINAKCVDSAGVCQLSQCFIFMQVVVHFATNSIKFLDCKDFSNIHTKCELNLKGRAVMYIDF
jgi:hypothetical protein